MKIRDGIDNQGNLIYLEIDNIIISRKSICKILKNIPNLIPVKEDLKQDTFFIFQYGSKIFEVMEPFGDNSRYHISTNPAINCEELVYIHHSLKTND